MTLFLGVDPGATGAIACVYSDGYLIWVEDMPDPLHGATIADLLDSERRKYTAAVEDVHSMPGQGVSTTFKFGMNHGIVLGALGALRIPYRLVTPGQWKKAMRVTAVKETARQRAIELWPAHAQLFARKKDHGRAEAALIARWLYEQTRVTVAGVTDIAIVDWFLASALALLVAVIAVGLVAYCVWDFWGRYVAVRREAEKAKRR